VIGKIAFVLVLVVVLAMGQRTAGEIADQEKEDE
jgi:hypothetical protein